MTPGRQTTTNALRNSKYKLNVPNATGHLVAEFDLGAPGALRAAT